MKASTLLLCAVAAIAWMYVFKRPVASAESGVSAPPTNPNAPRVTLVGHVQEKTPEGVIVLCASRAGAGNPVGRVLLRACPDEGQMSRGEPVSIQTVQGGMCESGGESLRAYWCVGGAPPPSSREKPQWHSSLDEPAQRVGTHSWSGR